MSGRPKLQHSNITWYVIQQRKNERISSIIEDLSEPEMIESEVEPLEISTNNFDVFVSDYQIKNTLKKSLTLSPANDIIKYTPQEKPQEKRR